MINVAILIISDKSSLGLRDDQTGPALIEALSPHARVRPVQIVPDEFEVIKATLIELADAGEYDIIFTSGGTGLSPRDVTPEATLAAIERPVPGIPEAMRAASLEITPHGMLSRAVAGLRGKTLIINLPGSPKAALENVSAVIGPIAHGLRILRGGQADCAAGE